MTGALANFLIIIILIFGIWFIVAVFRADQRRQQKNPKWQEEKARREEARQKYLAEREQRKLAQTVVKTRILDGYSVTRGSGGGLLETAGRAMIGERLGGPVGAIIGGATARRTYREYRYTTFKVWYGDGKTKIKTVSNGSYDWEKFIEKLEE